MLLHLASWWTNNILASVLDVLRFDFLNDYHKRLRAVLPTRIELLAGLNI